MAKICSKCGEEKPLGGFTKDRTTKSGYRPSCKECTHRYNQSLLGRASKLRYARSEKGKEATKRFAKTEKRKDIIYRQNNLESGRARKYKYSQTDKGKAAKIRSEHKRRAKGRELPATLTAKQWLEIIQNQENKCNHCKTSFENVKPTRDHIIPLSKGGGLTRKNVQALCRSCNSSKGNRMEARVA